MPKAKTKKTTAQVEAEAQAVLEASLAKKKRKALDEINQVLDKYNFNIVLSVAFSSNSNNPAWQMDLAPLPKPAPKAG